MTYTTEQLLDFLDQELRASWKGERVVLSSAQRLNNPVIAKAIGTDKLSKIFALQDFRAQIHDYQRQHGVSGLVWRTCSFGPHQVHVPELHPQLAALPEDKTALMAAKGAVIDFWQQGSAGLKLWRGQGEPQPLSRLQVDDLVATCEWAEVVATRTELYLSLCWGNPQECHCDWARPDSGCERIIAAPNRPSGIKV